MHEVVKPRRRLNKEQLDVLELLYTFRFGSNNLFAEYFGKRDRSFVYKRLSILLERGLIGKRFESSYRLQGKPVAYYLTADGARELTTARGIDVNIKTLYKDKTVSEQFVRNALELFAVHNQLKAHYGDELKFFTKTNMNHEDYEYFPQPLPDAYIRLKVQDTQFFLDMFYDDQPYFVAKRRMKYYLKYEEDDNWAVTDTSMPAVLAVCESPHLVKRVQKYMTKALDHAWNSKVIFAFTTKTELISNDTTIWRKADKPNEQLTLQDIL